MHILSSHFEQLRTVISLWAAQDRPTLRKYSYHIQLGWCLGRSLGCLEGLDIVGLWSHMQLGGTEDRGEKKVRSESFIFKKYCACEQKCGCASYLSRYEVGRSLGCIGERQLLSRDHHHLWARTRLVDMGGRHRARCIAGRNTSGPTPWRQAAPVGVVGLEKR